MKPLIKLNKYENAFSVKGKNRRFAVVKKEDKNIIEIMSLTSETGKELGFLGKLSENEKIKYSLIGLSDEALFELYICIKCYLKNI